MKGNTASDWLCLDEGALCYETEFVLVKDHYASYYMYGINQADVGGIIGIGLSNITNNSFWDSGIFNS